MADKTTYPLIGGVQAYDGTSAALKDFRESTSLDRRPLPSNINSDPSIAAVAGLIPYTNHNIMGAATARQDAASKDIGIGIYSIPLNNVLASEINNATETANVVYTAPATGRTFLTGIQWSFSANVTADNTLFSILGNNVANAVISLLLSNKLSLTAIDRNGFIPFLTPLEIYPSSTIRVTNTFAAGASCNSCVIYGYKTTI